MSWFTKVELLPQSKEELEKYVAELIKDYGLPDTDDTFEMIATAIMHVNPNISEVPRNFFASQVRKGLANKAAYDKLSEFRFKREAAKKAEELTKSQSKLTAVPDEKVQG